MRAHMMRKDAQATIWEKVCANHTTNKVQEARIYNEFSKLCNKGKQTTQLKHGHMI